MKPARNSRELLHAVAEWLAWQEETLSFGLRSAADGLKLYNYFSSRPELPEFCDRGVDDEGRDLAEHRILALGYDPMTEPATEDAPTGI